MTGDERNLPGFSPVVPLSPCPFVHLKADHSACGVCYDKFMTILCMHILRLVRERLNSAATAAAGPDVPLHVQLR